MTSDPTGRVVRLHDDMHGELQALLPWYVTGVLDPADRVRIGAHLETCAECRADVAFERRLSAEVARLPVGVDAGWAAMRKRLEDQGSKGVERHRLGTRGIRHAAPWLGLMAASLALTLGAAALFPQAPKTLYHALGSAPSSAAGNVVVIFRPDATEKALRETLNATHARLVDGPTAADAYVLRVPPAERAAALVTLRSRAAVVLAEPIDSTSPH